MLARPHFDNDRAHAFLLLCAQDDVNVNLDMSDGKKIVMEFKVCNA